MPGGRPPSLTKVVDRTPDGEPITAAEKVLELTRTVWSPRQYRAAGAGITTVTFNAWLREGGLARAAIARGEKVTAAQKRYAEFLTAYEKAEAEAIAVRLGTIHDAAKGGWVKTKTTVKVDGEGSVIEETTTTETIPPQWQAAAWMLERRRPQEFGRRVEVTGANGEPLVPKEDRADVLASAMEGYLRGVDDARESESV
jgi:hypothetical protein